MHRSPPPSSQEDNICRSEPDVSKASSQEFANISTRIKRRHPDAVDFEHQFTTFKDEIKSLLTSMFESWKKDQECTMSKIVREISEIKNQHGTIKEEIQNMEKSVDFMSTRCTDLDTKFSKLEQMQQDYNLHIQTLEESIDELQRISRLSKLEIKNLPKTTDENKDSIASMLLKMAHTVNVSMSQSDVRDVYRLPIKGSNIVIAEMTSPMLKSKLITAVRKYNTSNKQNQLNTKCLGFINDPQPIYVSDNLTPKSRRLHFLARDFAKSNEYEFCWATNGKIYLRKAVGSKQIIIKSAEQLASLKKTQ